MSEEEYSVGDLLRQHREYRGWTQKEAAKELNCDHTRISRIERGDFKTPPDEVTIQEFCEVYDLSNADRQQLLDVRERQPNKEGKNTRELNGKNCAGKLDCAVNTPVSSTSQISDLRNTENEVKLETSETPLDIPKTPEPFAIKTDLHIRGDKILGRDKECERFFRELMNPATFCLNLHGLGGAGKTWLAYKLAMVFAGIGNNVHVGRGKVHLIKFESTDGSNMLTKIIGATGIQRGSDERSDQRLQLLNYLNEDNVLLILDNITHFLEDSKEKLEDLLAYLISRMDVDKSKILLTSRDAARFEKLSIIERSVGGMLDSHDSANTLDFDHPVVQLFDRHAFNQNHKWQLTEHNIREVSKICILLGGNPLLIRILASNTLYTDNLKFCIAQFKNGEFHKLEEIQRAKEIFQHAWKALNPITQRLAMQLAFLSHQIDSSIVDYFLSEVKASQIHLHELVSRSLLDAGSLQGKYSFHDWIRSSIQAELENEHEIYEMMAKRFRTYFCAFITTHSDGIEKRNHAVNSEIFANWNNITNSLRLAISSNDAAVVEVIMNSTSEYLFRFGRSHLAKDFYAEYLPQIEELFIHQLKSVDLGHWFHCWSDACYKTGALTCSKEHAITALAFLGCKMPASSPISVFGYTLPSPLNIRTVTAFVTQEILRYNIRIWNLVSSPNDKFCTISMILPYSKRHETQSLCFETLAQVEYFYGNNENMNYAAIKGLNSALAAKSSSGYLATRNFATISAGLATVPDYRSQAKWYRDQAWGNSYKLEPDHKAYVGILVAMHDIGIGNFTNIERILNATRLPREVVTDRRRTIEALVQEIYVYEFRGEFVSALKLWDILKELAIAQCDNQAHMWWFSRRSEQLLDDGFIPQQVEKFIVEGLEFISKYGDSRFNVNSIDRETSLEKQFLALMNVFVEITKLIPDNTVTVSHKAVIAFFSYSQEKNYKKTFEKLKKILDVDMKEITVTTYTNMIAYSMVAELILRIWQLPEELRILITDAECTEYAEKALLQMHAFAQAFPVTQPRYLIWNGLYSQLRGKTHEAESTWFKCHEYLGDWSKENDKQQMLFDKALLLYELADNLPEEQLIDRFNMDKSTCIDECERLFDQCNSNYRKGMIQELRFRYEKQKNLSNPSSTQLCESILIS